MWLVSNREIDLQNFNKKHAYYLTITKMHKGGSCRNTITFFHNHTLFIASSSKSDCNAWADATAFVSTYFCSNMF